MVPEPPEPLNLQGLGVEEMGVFWVLDVGGPLCPKPGFWDFGREGDVPGFGKPRADASLGWLS